MHNDSWTVTIPINLDLFFPIDYIRVFFCCCTNFFDRFHQVAISISRYLSLVWKLVNLLEFNIKRVNPWRKIAHLPNWWHSRLCDIHKLIVAQVISMQMNYKLKPMKMLNAIKFQIFLLNNFSNWKISHDGQHSPINTGRSRLVCCKTGLFYYNQLTTFSCSVTKQQIIYDPFDCWAINMLD